MKIVSKTMCLPEIKWSSSQINLNEYINKKSSTSLAVDEILVFVSLNLKIVKCIPTDTRR